MGSEFGRKLQRALFLIAVSTLILLCTVALLYPGTSTVVRVAKDTMARTKRITLFWPWWNRSHHAWYKKVIGEERLYSPMEQFFLKYSSDVSSISEECSYLESIYDKGLIGETTYSLSSRDRYLLPGNGSPSQLEFLEFKMNEDELFLEKLRRFMDNPDSSESKAFHQDFSSDYERYFATEI